MKEKQTNYLGTYEHYLFKFRYLTIANKFEHPLMNDKGSDYIVIKNMSFNILDWATGKNIYQYCDEVTSCGITLTLHIKKKVKVWDLND